MGSAAPTNKRTKRKIGGAGSEAMPVALTLSCEGDNHGGSCAAFLAGLRSEGGPAPVFGCSVHGAIVNAWRGIGITSQKQIGCTPIVCCSDYVVRYVELDSGVCLVSIAAMKESHEAVLDSHGCCIDINSGSRRLQ